MVSVDTQHKFPKTILLAKKIDSTALGNAGNALFTSLLRYHTLVYVASIGFDCCASRSVAKCITKKERLRLS